MPIFFYRASSVLSKMTVEEEEAAERTFLTPKSMDKVSMNVPSLDEFNAEIDIYRVRGILDKKLGNF